MTCSSLGYDGAEGEGPHAIHLCFDHSKGPPKRGPMNSCESCGDGGIAIIDRLLFLMYGLSYVGLLLPKEEP